MHKKSLNIFQNVFLWLVLPLTIGLFGLNWRKKKSHFQPIRNSQYKDLEPFIIAQSKLESGNFSSPLFLRANNLFGMKNAFIRNQLGYAVLNDHFRYYNSPADSVKDYLIYLDFVNFPLVDSAEKFVSALKQRNYFEEDENFYLNGMKKYL